MYTFDFAQGKIMNYDEYTQINGPWTSIDGWNQQGAFTALKIIHDIQHEKGIVGNIGELGVHEGQFFFALMLLTDITKERSLAIDVFDNQKRNVDNSGGSSFEEFYENLYKIIPNERLKVFRTVKEDSLVLQPMRLLAIASAYYTDSTGVLEASKSDSKYTPLFRLFSIDGGHTVIHVLNDLRLAEKIMTPGGVVLVDDFMHPKWPGVTEGLHIYCNDSASLLVPFAYGNNKMYLTTFDYAKYYRQQIVRNLTNVRDRKEVELWKRNIQYLQFE